MATDEAEKNAIRELLATYCFHLDNYRFAEMAALFTEDGTWDTAFGKGTGRPGIVAQAELIGMVGARPKRVHLTTNIVIALNGDSATVQSNWTVIQNSASGPKIGAGRRIPGSGGEAGRQMVVPLPKDRPVSGRRTDVAASHCTQ